MTNRIKALREARGLSLDSVARHVGTTPQQIGLLETGKRRLTVDWLTRLGEALDCHPWAMVGDGRPAALHADEIQLLEMFRQLSPRQRRPVLELVGSIKELTPKAGKRR